MHVDLHPSLRSILTLAALAGALSAQILLPAPAASPQLTLGSLGPDLPIVSVDMNGDGDADVVHVQGSGFAIHDNQGGTFVRTTYTVPGTQSTLTSLAAGDIDGDGHVDLVVGLTNDGPRIYWGDGTGNWPTPNPLQVPIFGFAVPTKVALGDVDNDGDLDMVNVHSSFASNPSFLYRNLGNRAFVGLSSAIWPNGNVPFTVPNFVDVDGDGWRDCLFLPLFDGFPAWLYWNNSGVFSNASTTSFPSVVGRFVSHALADLDGDGDRDLLLAGDGNSGRFLRAVAPRQFVVETTVAPRLEAARILTEDHDQDGDFDLTVFSRLQTELWANDGTGQFVRTDVVGDNANVDVVVPADFDGDGDLDMLRVSRLTNETFANTVGTIAWRVRAGQYQFSAQRQFAVFARGITDIFVDVDGDRLPDVPIGNLESVNVTLQVAKNRGDGTFAFRRDDRPFTGSTAFEFFPADLDMDGLPEWVQLADLANVSTCYFANLGGTLATTSTPLPVLPFGLYNGGGAADVDGDGDRDLVLTVTVGTWSVLRVLDNQGGTFVDVSATRVSGPPIAQSSVGDPCRVLVGDFDGDGVEDVATFARQSFVWRNVGGVLTFVPGAITIDAFSLSRPRLVDMDGDGDLDFFSLRTLLRNRGDGTFVTETFPGNMVFPFVADLDDDGDQDVFTPANGFAAGAINWNNGNGTFTAGPGPNPTGTFYDGVADLDLDGDPDAIRVFNGPLQVFWNQLRQLEVIGSGSFGTDLQFRYSVQPGQNALPVAAWLAIAFERATPVFVPDFGWLQVDPLQATLFGPFLLPAAGGSFTHIEAVPAIPALLGATLAAQPVELRGSRFRLGNCVSTLLGR